MDRPALPVLPSSADRARLCLYTDADDRRDPARRPPTAVGLILRATGRLHSAAAIRRRWRQSAHIGAVRLRRDHLNVGCPSDRVRRRFGACLMIEPALVADCGAGDESRCRNCRTGEMQHPASTSGPRQSLGFIRAAVKAAGTDCLDRACTQKLAEGLSPRENREVPPLDCEIVASFRWRILILRSSSTGGIARWSKRRPTRACRRTVIDGPRCEYR